MVLPPDPYQQQPPPDPYRPPQGPYIGDQPPWPGMPPTYGYPPAGHSQTSNTFVPYPQKTVIKSRKGTSHTFHLIMTVLTCGLWGLFVWLPMWAWNAFGPRSRTTQRNY
jgi:hypothetical protein